jgi:glycolate oxidase iron-sulfur subunit
VKEVEQGCCGALHAHNGYLDQARKMATELVGTFRGDLPIVINSAGCGSTMKEYGHLLQEATGAEAFSSRCFDISEFLLANGLVEALKNTPGLNIRATYHDACHLAHGQKITKSPRELLDAIPGLDFVPLPEADMCCGSAGIYNVLQPEMARSLIDRKYGNVRQTGASVVATGNPGCHAWIAQAARERGDGVQVFHTVELLEAAFIGLEPFQ